MGVGDWGVGCLWARGRSAQQCSPQNVYVGTVDQSGVGQPAGAGGAAAAAALGLISTNVDTRSSDEAIMRGSLLPGPPQE